MRSPDWAATNFSRVIPRFTDTPKLARLELLSRFVPDAFRRVSYPLVCGLLARRGSADAARKGGDAWLVPNALPHPYFFTRLLFPPTELSRLTEPRFRNSAIAADGVTLDPTWLSWLERTADQARELEPIAAISWLEMRSYMASTLLRDTDSVSMACSLEVRVPLLDTPLVEFMCALPDAARVRPETPKALLARRARRPAACGDLSTEKAHLHFALGRLDAHRAEAANGGELFQSRARPRHASAFARRSNVWNNFLQGQTTWSRPWSLYVLNEWCRRHLS